MLSVLAAGDARAQESGLTAVHFKAPEFPALVTSFASPERSAPGPLSSDRPPNRTGGGAAASADQPGVVASLVVWINSAPLAMSDLRGKVVLIDFWEYTCINCIRTFPQNKKWYERYHQYGFEIIGVHDPEFDIAYPVKNIREAVKRFGLPYPIVVDSQFKIWQSYHNSSWPNRFLIDVKGFVRFNRPGEGADSGFEHAIQDLLREARPGLTFPASYAVPPEDDLFAPTCGIATGEMYVGEWFGRGALANTEGYRSGKTVAYTLPSSVEDGRAAVSGRWEADKNGMICRGKPTGGKPSTDRLVMRYHARELYSVMNVSHGKSSRIYIKQDGKDLSAEDKGVDVQIDSEGHSYIDVREPRMYYLVQNPAFGSHTVELFPTAPGLTVNSFTFGNNCQTKFAHL